jgi:hypothetical protein
MNYISTGAMCESGYGVAAINTIEKEKLGNYTVLFGKFWEPQDALAVAELCCRYNLEFVLDEITGRLDNSTVQKYSASEMEKILSQSADHCGGSLFMCEYGGLTLYWPHSTVKNSCNLIAPTHCAATARENLVEILRKRIQAAAKDKLLPRPVISIEASGNVAKYLYESGIDRVDLEVIYDKYIELNYAAARGAAIANGEDKFGTDMAMVWYGGNQHDSMWFKRWKISLYHAFIRGADPIYAEHGLLDYKALGKCLDADSPEVSNFRATLGEFAAFTSAHPRPDGFPSSRIAVISGNLDSYAGQQPFIWGQRNDEEMRKGFPEDSWQIFNSLFEKQPWQYRYQCGEQDFSANPPLGNVDIIPAEASLDIWQRYEGVVFLGWNTMTNEIYEKMQKFVEDGGHLLCGLCHLDERTDRSASVKLPDNQKLCDFFGVEVVNLSFQSGDYGIKFKQRPAAGKYQFPLWSDICDPKYYHGGFPMARLEINGAAIVAGLSDGFGDSWDKILSRPVLTANNYGKGVVMLVNTLAYPAHPGLKDFYQDLLYHFRSAFQSGILVESSNAVRYAVYPENEMEVVYLLNTDYNLPQTVLLSCGANRKVSLSIPAASLKTVYLKQDIMFSPTNNCCRVLGMEKDGADVLLDVHGDNAATTGDLCWLNGTPSVSRKQHLNKTGEESSVNELLLEKANLG